MPSLGAPEIIIILVLALLVFGPKRLPEMGRSLGRTVREFKKASDTARKEFGVDEIEKELKGVKSELKDVQKTVTDVKTDLKIDVDAEAAKPDPGKAEGATAVAAGATAVAGAAAPDPAAGPTPDAVAASEDDAVAASEDDAVAAPGDVAAAVPADDAGEVEEEVLVGDVVDEGPAVDPAPVGADEAVLDVPVDVTDATAGYGPPAVSPEPSPDAGLGAPAGDGETAAADAQPQGA